MRPNVSKTDGSDYECFGCGYREREPDPRVCPKCGSEMRNIGQPRDR